MGVRERWIYPSDGSPPYQVDTDYRQPRPVAPAIGMNLGTYNSQERRNMVPVTEHKNVVKDWQRQREYKRQDQKKQRLRDVVDTVKGYGI